MTEPMRGPDGWRFGVIQWEKSIQPSRLPHYFERGNSLCGVYNDAPPGYHPHLLEPDHPGLKYVCKACKKKVEKRGPEALVESGITRREA